MNFSLKIWKKFVLFSMLIISIVLSLSRYYIVKNNFLKSIENTSKQNTNRHILEKYMLESDIVKSIQDGEEITDEKIIEFFKSLNSYMEASTEFFALYNENFENVYSNLKDIENLEIKDILNQNKNLYCLRKLGDKHYMFFSSNWNINNKVIYIVNAYDASSIYEEKDRQMQVIFVNDVIILSVITIAVFTFSIYLTRPISKLNKTSKKIASGQFNERVNIKSKDEIGELSESFNIMAKEVEDKINQLNLQVKQKNDFINAFTHELKTPMTAMMGYSDLLRLKKCDEKISQKALNYIYSETKRLESLSLKLMKLMSLTEENIEFSEINIVDFLEKIVKVESELFSNIKIELDLEEGIVKGDKELLEVVLRNLIENSKNSKPKDNKILVKGEILENKNYRISVIDKGKGIPKEHLERVTEDFYMVDKSRSRESNGSGIGLSLVKKILEFHNSKIVIESQENVGTTAYFELKEESNEN